MLKLSKTMGTHSYFRSNVSCEFIPREFQCNDIIKQLKKTDYKKQHRTLRFY